MVCEVFIRLLSCVSGSGGDLVSFSCQWVEKNFEEMLELLSAQGWITAHVLLRTQEWRYHWTL